MLVEELNELGEVGRGKTLPARRCASRVPRDFAFELGEGQKPTGLRIGGSMLSRNMPPSCAISFGVISRSAASSGLRLFWIRRTSGCPCELTAAARAKAEG